MHVLLLSQHYAPEVTAARFRVEAFAQAFAREGHRVSVVCPVPNHPAGVIEAGFRGRALTRRDLDGVEVNYVWVRTTPVKTTRERLAYYASYAAAAVPVAVGLRPDVLLASSPPLSVGAAAMLAARTLRRPWILDVRDLWPEAAVTIGELSEGSRAVRLAERLERRLYRSADRILTVTAPFVRSIGELATDPSRIELVANGTTRSWVEAGERAADRAALNLPEDEFIWTYAGNLGPSRRLDLAIEAAAELGPRFRLLIIGSGGAVEALERQAEQTASANVEFRPLMSAEDAARHMRASDALYVPQQPGLGDFVPSKLYDCWAVCRPAIVAAEGETLRLAVDADAGLGISPESIEELVEAVSALAADAVLCERLAINGKAMALEYLRESQASRVVSIAAELAGRRSRSR